MELETMVTGVAAPPPGRENRPGLPSAGHTWESALKSMLSPCAVCGGTWPARASTAWGPGGFLSLLSFFLNLENTHTSRETCAVSRHTQLQQELLEYIFKQLLNILESIHIHIYMYRLELQ